jgi:biopolymer transport protein ExbB
MATFEKGRSMATLILRVLMPLLLAIGAMPAVAQESAGWWNDEWSYRKAVTIDTSPSGVNASGAIGRTVVLVRLHNGNFTFTDALENGADLRFIDADGKTPLPFHIEKFDPTNGLAAIWVSVPNLNGGEKRQLWIYFGNENAPVGQDAKGTFDPDYLAAFHFGERPGQASADSTANGSNAQNAPPGIDPNGIVGQAARFPGQGAIQIAPTPALAMPAGAPMTFSAWVKPEQLAGQQAVFARGAMVFGLNAGVPFAQVGGATLQGNQALKQGDWTYLAIAADGTTVKLYVNGVEAAAASAALPALDGPITIGGAEGRPFTGQIDEARLSKTARPATMLLAMASAEGAGGKLVQVSESAEQPSEGGGVVMFIVSKLEPIDTGVVIICMMLLAAALFVMFRKNAYLNTSAKGNAVFLKRFRQMHEDLIPVDRIEGITPAEVAAINASPLGRIYAVGMDEFGIRRKVLGSRPLSGEAIEAMRSAVDAQVVEENQKLDAAMVLLTIAISGGPFIGLLGTVIGVMTVFGGVAMAGDVNVNAIAPGIAAALLATIAGLAAAIPSLFGYNYLNGRISKLSDDMRVFVDRLITRLAEMQHDAANPPPHAQAAE